mgnify:CR=1 FL=1
MDTTDKQKKKPPQKPKAVNTAWVGLITVISFALSVVMSYISNEALASAGTILSFAVLLLFIALGIVFDMIGVASTSATEKEFHSMAAHRVRGAREAVWMVRNAEKVSSICNDVVGDICGIVSGATSAVIVARLQTGLNVQSIFISVGVTALVSGLTIGGKAMCKPFAIKQSKQVVYWAGRFLHLFHRS